ISAGSTGANDPGNISFPFSSTFALTNGTGLTLKLASGTGAAFAGDITIGGLSVTNMTLVAQAGGSVTLGDGFAHSIIVSALSITSATGAVQNSAGGTGTPSFLTVGSLSITAPLGAGTASSPLQTSAGDLSVDTSGGNTDQFITRSLAIVGI